MTSSALHLEQVVAEGRKIIASLLKDAIAVSKSTRRQSTYRKTGGVQKLDQDFYRFRPQKLGDLDLVANEVKLCSYYENMSI